MTERAENGRLVGYRLARRLAVRIGGALFVVIVSVLIVATGGVFIGRVFSTTASLLDSYACTPLPCWHGIRPGETRLNEAQAALAANTALEVRAVSETQVYWRDDQFARWNGVIDAGADGTVQSLTLVPVGWQVRLGYLIDLLGAPDGYRCVCYTSSVMSDASFQIAFAGNTNVFVGLDAPCDGLRFSADTATAYLVFSYAPPVPIPGYGPFVDWAGYGAAQCTVRDLDAE